MGRALGQEMGWGLGRALGRAMGKALGQELGRALGWAYGLMGPWRQRAQTPGSRFKVQANFECAFQIRGSCLCSTLIPQRAARRPKGIFFTTPLSMYK